MSLFPVKSPIRYESAPNNVIRAEKDFLLKELKLIAYNGAEYDIRPFYSNLSFSEDIFGNSISGTLDLVDAIDFAQFMPIIGEEKIKVILDRQDETGRHLEGGFVGPLEFTLRVYKMLGKEIANEKSQAYRLFLVSEEFIKNTKTKVYKGWKSTLNSDMVQEVFDKYIKIDKPLVVEKTKYEHNFICRRLNPYQFINLMSSRSISDEGNGECFVFYEDREQFNFVSIGKLIAGDVKETYGFTQKQIKNATAGLSIEQPIEVDIKNVDHYHFNNQQDILEKLESGMYAQRIITVDPIRQVFETIDFDLNKEFETFPLLDKERYFTDKLDVFAPEAHIKLISTSKDHDSIEHISSKDTSARPEKYEEFVSRRLSKIHQMNNFKVGVTVSGDPRRKAGDLVEFKLPQIAGDIGPTPQELDRYFQGKFLVTSITHNLTQQGYTMQMELVKDTFFKPIEHTDVVEKYKDIW